MYEHLNASCQSLDILRSSKAFKTLFASALCDYFESARRSLAKRDNLHVCTALDRMHAIAGHSHSCLIGLLSMATNNIHGLLDRSGLDLSSCAAYEQSIEASINTQLAGVYKVVAERLNERCTSDKITTEC